jgi:ElaB/YqjD/DUF883 family membrane-anchored ribosome-binding protein
MNDSQPLKFPSEVPWPTHRPRVPFESMPHKAGEADSATANLLNPAAPGAHDKIDRLADHVAPATRQLDETVSIAKAVVSATTDGWREKQVAWVDGARNSVRAKPLTTVVAAIALGALIARLSR